MISLIKSHKLFFVIVFVGLCLRLYNINLPLLDAKPHREIHTAEETRNIFYDKEIFYPKAKLWADEPGYYIVEFPLYNGLVALLYHFFGIQEVLGKMVSMVASVGVATFFYLFVLRIYGKLVAYSSLIFIYLLSPQEIVLSRSYQPDQLGFFLGLLSIFYFSKWLDKRKIGDFLIAWFGITFMLLVKISFFPFLFPIIFMGLKKMRLKTFTDRAMLLYVATTIPVALWYLHVKTVYSNFPQLHSAVLISPTDWLTIGRLFDLHWLVNVFYDFVDQVITLPIAILTFMAFFLKQKSHFGLIFSWLVGLLLYILFFIGKFHFWYYQVPLLFPLAILAGLTVEKFYAKYTRVFVKHKLFAIVLVFGLMILTGRPYLLRTYEIAQIHESVIPIATKVKEIAKPHAKIIASSHDSAALTYYALRPDMWGGTLVLHDPSCINACVINKFEELRAWGASLYALSDKQELSVQPEFAAHLKSRYKTLYETDISIIFDISNQVL